MIEQALQSPLMKWQEKTYKKQEFLTHAGEVEKHIYFIISGAFRAFTEVDDEEFTIRFGYKNSIITSLPSYFNNQPSETYIQAIRKSKVLYCAKKEFEVFLASEPTHLKAYKKILEDLVSSLLEREIDLMQNSPARRLERVLKRSPQLFQEVPHKYIAAYLRMSPETLSRLLYS
ncbi:MAG: Crp/Fnr family transcriptional regulator [Vicingaceae bacterium]